MSDSECDLLPSNVFTFQNENTTVCAKGPNVNNANITSLSFRNNVMTSTMHMSRNFGRHHYGEPSFDQRSMYNRRETLPMSLYSGSDRQRRNQSYYHGGMSSQRSMYHGRSGSPMSMRSMDSNVTVSAVDIAMAFKNENFNKYDLRMIKEAYNKFMKRRIRKKIEKRRNMRLFLKGYRRKSGYDSGEQGSDSSISSDDCKSTASAMYKDNMSSCRSTRTDLTDFRQRIKESNMYTDCTQNFKQHTMKNLLLVPPATSRDRFRVPDSLPTPKPAVQNQQPFTQKDRFQNGFLLPSHRFNKSVASVPIPERSRLQGNQNISKPKSNTNKEYVNTQDRINKDTDSDQEEIFSEITVRENATNYFEHQSDKMTGKVKRCLEVEEYGNMKRPKISPVKPAESNGLIKNSKESQFGKKINSKIVNDNSVPTRDNTIKPQNDTNSKDFDFIKPQLPVKKSGPGKPKEKLISKSAPPLVDAIIHPSFAPIEPAITTTSITNTSDKTNPIEEAIEDQPDATQNSNTDLSMRPSFIKRKLFSQKMDVTERKNMSSDAINSPQANVYSAIQKEKHKARKLVTNQSCLSRDVGKDKDDNNLLDLIHKIVPPDRMNVTNVTNKTSISTNVSSKNNQVDDDDKWDVTSVISTCNNDNVSDTYTDEEIFGVDEKKQKISTKVVKNNNNVNNAKKANECKILVEKLPKNVLAAANPIAEMKKNKTHQEENGYLKKSVYNCVKTFWDTDFESDVESAMPKRFTSAAKENRISLKGNHSKSIIVEADKIIKNKNTLNTSLVSVSESIKSKTMPTNNMSKLKFNISKNLSIKSFLTPKHKNSKTKEQKSEKVIEQKEDCSQTKVETKQANKQTTATKTKNDLGSKNVKEKDKAKTITTKNNKTKPSPNRSNKATKQSINENKAINITSQSSNINVDKQKQPANKAKNNKPSQSTNTTKNNEKPSQSPCEPKKRGRPPKNAVDNSIVNRTSSSRAVRTPKRKSCCGDAPDHDNASKPASNSNSNPSKKPKLVDISPVVDKAPKKNTNAHGKNNTRKNNNNIDSEKDLSLVYESEPPNRTLRTRRIDLSSSINSSIENLTTLKLRTRRVDLSSSLKNSSLDDNVTIIKNSRSKAHTKKTNAKAGYAESIDKRQRR